MSGSGTTAELDRAIVLALDDRPLDGAALTAVLSAAASGEGAGFERLLAGARSVRRRNFDNNLHLCAIVNAKSGNCSEDCAFCAQSSRHKTASPRHGFLDPKKIARAAVAARTAGATRFGIVASGLALSESDFKRLLDAVRLVRETGLKADASVGLLSPERLARLTQAGLSGVHHNLETARSFFPQICTTHAYEDDVEVVRQALAAGLFVCCGGIFGLGESWEQRAELGQTLLDLGVKNVPVNFLVPIAGTRLEHRPVLPRPEALGILALLRLMLPHANLRVCGGRGAVFGEPGGAGQRELLNSGASGLMIGDYLTIAGSPAEADLALARELGFHSMTGLTTATGTGAATGPGGSPGKVR
ncbi:MAG: biotin synthase BioB [Proteobacteria bacterium]|nr:biotin synthase BioB [Pseudomonadota bacterium]